MSDMPPARRTDGTRYAALTTDHKGNGYRRMCAKCGQAKAIKPGWRKWAGGMKCPECAGAAA